MAYCTIDDVRNITGLSTSDITDLQLAYLISSAIAEVNADLQIKWEDESIGPISSEKENDIDGSNKTYYTRHYPIGDLDNNGTICGADVYCYKLDSNSNRSDVIVSSVVNSDIGKIWLGDHTSAPVSTDRVYLTYYSSPVDMRTPHALVKLACMRLAAAMASTKIDASKIQSFRVGKVAVTKQSQAFDIFKRQYYDTINRIRSKIFKVERGSVEI